MQLNDDDQAGQDAIYAALLRFQTVEGAQLGSNELHIVLADEDASAFPPEADVLFVRE